MNMKKLLKLFEAPVSPGAITSAAQASGLADPNKIKPGQQIRIPMQGGGYVNQTVKKGDTLSGMISRAQTTQGARAATAPKAATPNAIAGANAGNQTSSGYTAQSQAQKPATSSSAQASAALDAAKKNVIGGAQAAQTTAQASAALDAAKKNAIGGAQTPTQTAQTPTQTAQTTSGGGFQGGGYGSVGAGNTAALPTDQTQVSQTTSGGGFQGGGYGSVGAGNTAQSSDNSAPAQQNTAAPAGAGGYAQSATAATNNPMPKPDTQAVAGSSNLVTRTPDQIAADNKTPMGQYNPNKATKSYASFGDFASAIGDKFKSATGTKTAAPAAPVADQTGSTTATTSAVPTPPPMEPKPLDQAQSGPQTGGYGKFSEEEELEEDLKEMLRLSGITINEKAVSKQQQKFMGMVHAMQKGEKIKGASPELKKVAKTMGKKDAKDFASTKHKGLPQRVSESVMLEAGSNLEHIITRFKHETKKFLNGDDLDEDLYNALYDYYIDNGEMPYVVAKARQGEDPYSWVTRHFEDELTMMGHQRQFQETVMPVMDSQLSELARLAGLSEASYKTTSPSSKSTPSGNKPQQPAKVSPSDDATKSPAPQKKKDPFDPSNFELTECGDMGMDQDGSLNISTNMSSDGKKSVTISAQGEEAAALMQMLKLAGMGHVGHGHDDDEPVVMISSDDEEMMEYANDPNEEYHSIDSIMHQGNDLNREKRQYADKPKLGDNPMAEEISLDEELEALLNSVLLKDNEAYLSEPLKLKSMDPEADAVDTARVNMTTLPSGRVSATFPPPQKPKAPDQSKLPLQNEPFHGPRSLKIDGEKTGTEKEVDEGSIEKSGSNDLTGTWSANPPKKGQPDVPPPVPMDPVYPAAKGKAPGSPSSPGIPKPGKQK